MSNKMALSIGLTIAGVIVGGWKSAIPGMDMASASKNGAGPLAALTAFTEATAALSTQHTATGSYVGTALSPASSAQLAWATAEQYCLQTRALHIVGPGALPLPGPCPPG
jgi:hypothetical protein